MSQKEFAEQVQATYGCRFLPGDVWTLYGDNLIVCNPEKPPRMYFLDGSMEEIKPYDVDTDHRYVLGDHRIQDP